MPARAAAPCTSATAPGPKSGPSHAHHLALAGGLLLLLAEPALACSVCGCGDPLLISNDPAAINGTLRIQLDVELLRVDAGTDGRPGFTDQLTQTSYRLGAAYRPSDDLSLSATLPLVWKRIRTVGGPTAETSSDLTGIGDAELGARYSLWRAVQIGAQRSQELALGLGTSLPTGGHAARMADGSLVDPHGQLGTGGWGPFAGLHYRFEQGSWTAYANLAYRIRTEGSYPDGSKYRYGNAWLWSAHAQYLLSSRVGLDLGLDGRAAAADRATAPHGLVTGRVENTGGTVIALAPGLFAQLVGGLWGFARAQIQVHQALSGEQDVKPTFTVGVQYLIW